MAAAAWSCVENLLQLDQVTSAPNSNSVSISTAVSMVMCKHPAMCDPASGLPGPYFLRSAISPGISFSAIWISFLPQSASEMSATLHCNFVSTWDTRYLLIRRTKQDQVSVMIRRAT